MVYNMNVLRSNPTVKEDLARNKHSWVSNVAYMYSLPIRCSTDPFPSCNKMYLYFYVVSI